MSNAVITCQRRNFSDPEIRSSLFKQRRTIWAHTCSGQWRECAVVSVVPESQLTASPTTDARPQTALKARNPMQIIHVLSISNVNTRRTREATEHFARQSIVIESISEAKNVYEGQGLSMETRDRIDRLSTSIWYGRQRTFPATGHRASDVISSDLARPFFSP